MEIYKNAPGQRGCDVKLVQTVRFLSVERVSADLGRSVRQPFRPKSTEINHSMRFFRNFSAGSYPIGLRRALSCARRNSAAYRHQNRCAAPRGRKVMIKNVSTCLLTCQLTRLPARSSVPSRVSLEMRAEVRRWGSGEGVSTVDKT